MRSRRVVPFHMTQRLGYFGQLTHCVFISAACEAKGVEPYFFLESDIACEPGMSRNALSYYFTQPNLDASEVEEGFGRVVEGNCVSIRNRHDINAFWSGDASREIAHSLSTVEKGARYFHRNLLLRPELDRLTDEFFADNFAGKRVLGVHFRGTDKFKAEADPISYEVVTDAVDRALASEGYDAIYAATDDPGFLDSLARRWPHEVIWRVRPEQARPHTKCLDGNYEKGVNAILDWSLLARTHHLIKTPSLLSAWCTVVRPDLPVTLVGRPRPGRYADGETGVYGYWPEACFYRAADCLEH